MRLGSRQIGPASRENSQEISPFTNLAYGKGSLGSRGCATSHRALVLAAVLANACSMRSPARPLALVVLSLALSNCGGGGGGDSRFDDAGATIIDNEMGIEWEKKNSADGISDYLNPHDVDNDSYSWSRTGTSPDGSAYSNFLSRLNDSSAACYAGHCDWRLPTLEELRSIVIEPPDCGASPCIVDAAFRPDASCDYWTSTTQSGFPNRAWFVGTSDGRIGNTQKIDTDELCVRAVRDRF
jgi:hypothetical protein